MKDQMHLKGFFDAIENDGRISITHIGLYASLLQYWWDNGCPNPMTVFSYQMIVIAKISATTYHRCIRELSEYGYIRYEPSFKKNKASKIFLNLKQWELNV